MQVFVAVFFPNNKGSQDEMHHDFLLYSLAVDIFPENKD